jgi:integrase
MSDLTTAAPAGKRRERTILTDRLCETPVKVRKKPHDRLCPGLYVDIRPPCVASFYVSFTDAAGRPKSRKFGVYNRKTFNVAHARGKVFAWKAMGGAAIGETLRQKKDDTTKRGVIVNQVIKEYVEWMQGSDPKSDEPRRRSWGNVASYLRRYVGTRLGHMIASEVTNKDIAVLSDDILFGRFKVKGKPGKPSIACARHMRTAASAMFKWAAVPQRGYVTTNPCVNLDDLPDEEPRSRVLSEDEVRTLWHGLDRPDLPGEPRTRLALKFALVTMLRSWEVLGIQRGELNPAEGTVDIPKIRVKAKRNIQQPLSDLAWQIITEAMGDNDYAFLGRFGDNAANKKAMATALRGTKHANGKVKVPGLCALLGMKAFGVHDLRRTASTLLGELEDVSDYGISLCLDHQTGKDKDGNKLPAVTNKHYNLATKKRVNEKRKVLDRWAVELRRIIAEPAIKLRLAA